MTRKNRRWLIAVCLIAAAATAAQVFPIERLWDRLFQLARESALWGPVLFILAYVVCCVLLVPVSLLTFGAGAVYGLFQGTLLVWAAATLGAAAGFVLSRRLGREKVARLILRYPQLRSLDRAIAKEGWKIVFLCRLSPIFPFAALSYVFGVTRVRFGGYLLASSFGVLPPSFLYVYVGFLARLGRHDRSLSAAQWVMYFAGLAATAWVTLLLARIARKSLEGNETSDLSESCQARRKPDREGGRAARESR
ncbi:MAG: TVP38/TMEM64 family protein [Verrucomicrobia bacterium]|nr:TVP38/TMEM64 family protein [Verrucomicrobiota bacterium]